MTEQRTLPERLRTLAADARNPGGDTMKHWDEIRHQVETRKGSDLPRLNFESLIETFAEALDDAAEALDAKSALLAEAEKALEPFAEWIESRDANHASAGYPDACPLAFSPDRPNNGAATVGDLRRISTVRAKIKAALSG